MMIAFLPLLLLPFQKWIPPYLAVTPPGGYAALAKDLGATNAGIFVRGERLTLLSKGRENSFSLPDWMDMPFVRDEGADLWVAQSEMRGWDRAFFTYSQKVGGRTTRSVFYGRHAPKPPVSAAALTGSLESVSFPSKELGESRGVTVYLPPNVRPGLNAIYMADGQSCEAYARVLEPLILAKKIAPTAIVGLFHGEYKGTTSSYDMAQDFRAREYLKVADPDRFASHLKFVTEEVLPWAEAKFGLASGAAHRALFGFSNGAAFALMASVDRPGVFGSVMPFSVAAFDRDDLRKTMTGKRLPRYWLSAGTLESFIRNTQSATEILREGNAKAKFDPYVSGHDEAMWKIAFVRALPQIFPFHRS